MGSIFILLKKAKKLTISVILKKAMKEMDSPFSQFSNTWEDQNVGFGCHLFHTSTESNYEIIPYVDVDSGCVMLADVRLDYRIDLLRKLEGGTPDTETIPDCQLIMMSYLKWGENCVKHLEGDFAFVIWDKKRNKLFGARDHFGCRPLFYINDKDYFVISSDPKAFIALPGFRYLIDEQFIVDSISTIPPDKNHSAFKRVFKLPPAHTLTLSGNFPVQLNRYWDLEVQKEFANLTEDEAMRGGRDRFVQAVMQRSCSNGPIGVELSGGLDSSGIAACLKDILERFPVYAFTHDLAFDQVVKPYGFESELEYSSMLVQDKQIERHYIVTGEDNPGAYFALEKYLGIRPEAVGQGFAMLSDVLYKEVCNSGTNILLSGFGGDEGVSYQGTGLMQELVAKGEFRKLKETIRERIKNNGGNLHRQLIKQHILFGAPWLIRIFYTDWRKSRLKVIALNRSLCSKYRMKNKYFRFVYPPNDPDVRRRQFKRLMLADIPYRMENSYFAAKAHGIEYRYPFFDVRLVEFFFSLPSDLKYKNGIGRYIFRIAMKGILPDSIRLRIDKTGATIPNVLYRVVKDESIFRELIEEGRKNNINHYVDYNKLHWMLDQFMSEAARKNLSFGAKVFLNPISVLILQKWQREGKIDIGIKC